MSMKRRLHKDKVKELDELEFRRAARFMKCEARGHRLFNLIQ